jgi:ADP-ribosylglycohydrolase
VNPAHRNSPLSTFSFISDAQLAEFARSEARLTHAVLARSLCECESNGTIQHELSQQGAAFVNVLCRHLIVGKSWSEALELTKYHTALTQHTPRCSYCGRNLDWDEEFANVFPSPQTHIDQLDAGGYTPQTIRVRTSNSSACARLYLIMQAALYFIDRNDSFSNALNASLQFAGSANYCPVLVGAIAGARWGVFSILPADYKHCDFKLLRRIDTVVRKTNELNDELEEEQE